MKNEDIALIGETVFYERLTRSHIFSTTTPRFWKARNIRPEFFVGLSLRKVEGTSLRDTKTAPTKTLCETCHRHFSQ
jgi:hypothetical protein